MTITVAAGWWMIPGMMTLASVLFLIFWKGFLADAGSDIGTRAISGLLDLLVIGVFLIINLFAWLIWALLS